MRYIKRRDGSVHSDDATSGALCEAHIAYQRGES